MVTIGADCGHNFRVRVNPCRRKRAKPYFKVFNRISLLSKELRVVRFHFFDSGMEYHRDKYLDWHIYNNDIENIQNFMMKSNKKQPKYTNWKMTCYKWNEEYGFMLDNEEEYFNGEFDEKYFGHPSYIPSTTKMPDMWNYNPPKKNRAVLF